MVLHKSHPSGKSQPALANYQEPTHIIIDVMEMNLQVMLVVSYLA